MANEVESAFLVRFGDFELDLRTAELRTNGHRTVLQEKPFKILTALLEQPGEMVSREELSKRLWPTGTFVDFNLGLNKAVNRLREALHDSADQPRYIETLPKRGYRLIAPPAFQPSTNGSATAPFSPEQVVARHNWLPLGLILSLAFLIAGWSWIRYRGEKLPEPQFQRLTFGRGMILSARFAPDQQSVIYTAAWNGKPSELFWSGPGSLESRSLGLEAAVLSVSRSGEMAVLLNQRVGTVNRPGVLATVSLTGGAPRKLLNNVQDADWAPDGSKLVVAHYTAGGCALEFPLGKVLYETTGGAWLSQPRISPKGDAIAFLEHPLEDDNAGFVAMVDLAGNRKILSREFGGILGMAWDPASDAIWFSGREVVSSGPQALFKVTTAGKQLLVRRESGSITLQDVSRDGHFLVTRDSFRSEVLGRIYPETTERELGWRNYSSAFDFSPDGSSIVLSLQEESANAGYEVYLRKTDGSPAVRLGEGFPLQFSPDGEWVLTDYPSGIEPTSAPQLILLPTGAGQPVKLTHDSITHGFATLLPDRKGFVFEGSEPGRQLRSWFQDLHGGKPTPITPEGTVGKRVSPDGRLLVAVSPERKFWLYPVDRGQPRALSGVEPGEDVIRWSADGKYIFVSEGMPAKVYRVEVITGRRKLVYTLSPSDTAGLWNITPVLLTPDGRSYVYSDYRMLSDLYLASGIK
jgi:DNA-binding winged helix-turn-helix (wHTH) protein/Tol biopolymer transport system component